MGKKPERILERFDARCEEEHYNSDIWKNEQVKCQKRQSQYGNIFIRVFSVDEWGRGIHHNYPEKEFNRYFSRL